MTLNRKTFAVMIVLAAASSDMAAAKESPQEICKNRLLTYRQRYMCQQQLENIQTKADQKAVVRKYSDLIRAAEKPEK